MTDEKLRKYINDLDLDTFGIIRFEIANQMKTIISIAFPYNHLDANSENGFSIYTKRLDYHKVVRSYLDKICNLLIADGFCATAYVDNNPLPEKSIAELAGVGFIGKNGLITTEKYGSYVFLGEVVTDFIPTKTDVAIENLCGSCTRCTNACPTGGIQDITQCISFITQKKRLTPDEVDLLDGQIFGCDACQDACSCNRHIAKSPLPEFATLDFMNYAPAFYAEMNDQFFNDFIQQTSCGWRGKEIIVRNARKAIEN